MIGLFRDLNEWLREQFYAHQIEAWATLATVAVAAVAIGYIMHKRDEKASDR